MHRIRQSIQFYGRVQGVGFRYKLGYLADKYSVTGWARNEYDGSVSTELQGLEEDIDKIVQALYRRSKQQDIRERFPARLFMKISVIRSREKKTAVMCYCPNLRTM